VYVPEPLASKAAVDDMIPPVGCFSPRIVPCRFVRAVPRASPLLPPSAVGILARLSFNVLVIPLIFSTTAISVSPDSLNEYWFVIVGALVVTAISYVIPTALAMCIRIDDPHDFASLRIAATFPNVVALPILIFPSLCEYPFVYGGTAPSSPSASNFSGAAEAPSDDELRVQCVATSNTIIFVYFFLWSLLFWLFGYPQLLAVAQKNHDQNQVNDHGVDEGDARRPTGSEEASPSLIDNGDRNAMDTSARSLEDQNRSDTGLVGAEHPNDKSTKAPASIVSALMAEERTGDSDASSSISSTSPAAVAASGRQEAEGTALARLMSNRCVKALVRTVTSPGFLALAAGFATGCIPPLKAALFDSGGALRFLGSSLETLGMASNSISTMVVAASLVPPPSLIAPLPIEEAAPPPIRRGEASESDAPHVSRGTTAPSRCDIPCDLMEPDENPIMSDPTFGPYRRKHNERRLSSSLFVQRTQSMVRRQSARLVEALPLRSSPEMRRLLVWFTLSRLVLAPALVISLIVTLDCTTGVLSGVAPLAKLVVIFNSCVPGAMIVVVLLKAQPHLSRTAAAISKVYLPTYLIAIFSMAGWTTLGLLVTIPASSDDPTPMICPAKW
jgi:predicted permease